MASLTLLHGDCLEKLKEIPSDSVHSVITSPPYWALRDYGLPPSEWAAVRFIPMTGLNPILIPAWIGCLGLEPDPLMFVAHTVAVFREVRRVLRSDGTLWINLGDTYAGGGNRGGGSFAQDGIRAKKPGIDKNIPARNGDRRCSGGLKPKDLCAIPWRVMLALQADGWFLRSDIIWHKPNPMPESCTDRPTKAHEYFFMLTKFERYFYDSEAIREPAGGWNGSEFHDGKNAMIHPNVGKNRKVPSGWDTGAGGHGSIHRNGRASKNAKSFRGGGAYTANGCFDNSAHKERQTHGNEPNLSGTRSKRSVWTVSTQGFKEAHFATFPPKLIEPCILSGTSAYGCCPNCGAPWQRVVAKGTPDLTHQQSCGGNKSGEYHGKAVKAYEGTGAQNPSEVKARILAGMRKRSTTGWEPTCSCLTSDETPHRPIPCTVLDPFAGSGTTGKVALEFGRSAILIEMKTEYCSLINQRTAVQIGMGL